MARAFVFIHAVTYFAWPKWLIERRMRPPTVYLDSQDLSKFGDVLRDKSDAATERLFLALERRAQTGEAIFPISMPLLSELFQYDANFRETTLSKAEVIQRLSGSWALAYPSRVVAAEIAQAAERYGFTSTDEGFSVLSDDRYWFPDIRDALVGLPERMRAVAEAKVAELDLPTRAQRRRAKKLLRDFNPIKAAREIAPEFATKYDLPIDAVVKSIIPLLRGRITAEAASRRLFSAIAEPVRFVKIYFERTDTDRTALPEWMRKFGADLQMNFVQIRANLEPFLSDAAGRKQFDRVLNQCPQKFGQTILKFAIDDLQAFGLDPAIFPALVEQSGFVDKVPASYVAGRALVAYIRQIVGLSAQNAKIEHSFGGDLVHGFYLPHVDLWRADRRTAALVRTAVPRYADRIVSIRTRLPEAIDAWHLRAANRSNLTPSDSA